MDRIGLTWVALLALGCSHRPTPRVPGTTDVEVTDVSIAAADGNGELAVNYKPLKDALGLRVGSLLRPARTWNEFRLAEDGRRVKAHAQLFGYFDATVAEPILEREDKRVAVKWIVDEGPAYKIGSLNVVGAPPGTQDDLTEMISFGPGSAVDVKTYRPLRRELAEYLQSLGFGHARVYSRAWLDRDDKTVAWYYFVDAGPRTSIGSVVVEGNSRVPASVILERSGLRSGEPYSTTVKKRAELAVLDGGSMSSVVILNDADILAGPPQFPETGGTPKVGDDGEMLAREVKSAINLRVVVVEAPARELRVEAGVEADPERLDAFAGMRVLFRDVAAARNHIVLEASAGYGWELGSPDLPTGLYGEALARYVRASAISNRIDARFSARLKQDLFPAALSREVSVGPGIRSVLADNLFLDLDVLYSRAESIDFGPWDAMEQAEFALAEDSVSSGLVASSSLVLDQRNDRIEPTDGAFAAFQAELAPGGAIGTHRYLKLGGDLRKFVKLSGAVSVGARATGQVIALESSDGVPLGARLFGGGSFGFRGFGRQRLAPRIGDSVVGGLSLLEASLEARYLPFRGLYGAVAFLDVGAAGADANPLESGASGAFGLGARARTFFVPVSIDVSFRFAEEGEFQGPGDFDRWSLFFRIGEAF